jgi:thioesterase domain-containing protein/acyl carrier protein
VVLAPIERVDPDVPLDRLGIDSLMAIDLKIDLEQELGVKVPTVKLFEGVTIAGLAKLLSELLEEDVARDAVSPAAAAGGKDGYAESPSTPVPWVTIQSGDAWPPLFCIHPGVLPLESYAALARRLEERRPFYLLQPPELDLSRDDGRSEAEDGELSGIASRCLMTLRGIQERGPYLITGWSMGGIVAFEMARQLHEAGEPAGLTALFDSPMVFDPGRPVEVEPSDLIDIFARYLGARRGMDLPRPAPREVAPHADGALQQVLIEARKAGVVAPDAGMADLSDLLEKYSRGLKIVISKLTRWSVRPFPGTIHYYEASDVFDGARAIFSNATAAWHHLADDVQVQRVPGDHYTMLLSPNVDVLAEELRRQLMMMRAGSPRGLG